MFRPPTPPYHAGSPKWVIQRVSPAQVVERCGMQLHSFRGCPGSSMEMSMCTLCLLLAYMRASNWDPQIDCGGG